MITATDLKNWREGHQLVDEKVENLCEQFKKA
ncbi:hypothetical protein DFN09_002143 [Clostridium acetobutylicum]|nr:hypothetical protein [Clostridium acetobutylicum]